MFFLSIFDGFGCVRVMFSEFKHVFDENYISFFEHAVFFGFSSVDFDESFSDTFINFCERNIWILFAVFSEKSIEALVGVVWSYDDFHGTIFDKLYLLFFEIVCACLPPLKWG